MVCLLFWFFLLDSVMHRYSLGKGAYFVNQDFWPVAPRHTACQLFSTVYSFVLGGTLTQLSGAAKHCLFRDVSAVVCCRKENAQEASAANVNIGSVKTCK